MSGSPATPSRVVKIHLKSAGKTLPTAPMAIVSSGSGIVDVPSMSSSSLSDPTMSASPAADSSAPMQLVPQSSAVDPSQRESSL